MKLKEFTNFSDLRVVPVREIDSENRWTDTSLDPSTPELRASLESLGVTHPVVLHSKPGSGYEIVCGHRRVRLAREMGFETVPSFCVENLDPVTRLVINLVENRPHRKWSDIEKTGIIGKLHSAGAEETVTISEYMPLLGLERSKKWYIDALAMAHFPDGLVRLLHETNIPVRIYSLLRDWDTDSLTAATQLFEVVRPGVNKWREILECINEIVSRDQVTPAELLAHVDIRQILESRLHSRYEKFDQVFQWIHARRFPKLTDLQRQVWRAKARLRLDDQSRLRTPKFFENDSLSIELPFKNRDELTRQVERLFEVTSSAELDSLVDLFRQNGNGSSNGHHSG